MKTAIQFDNQIFTRQRDAFMGQIVDAVNGYFTIYSIYLGHRLGLYAALLDGDSLTSKQLAFRTNTHERYVREWLEQQAMIGTLSVADENATVQKRRYYLPPSHAEVLVNRESFNYLAPLAQAAVGAARPIEELETAFRTGGGISFESYGEDLMRGVGELNRPMFLHQLGQDYLPSIPDIHKRLTADPSARVADIGCGNGWSSIAMAQSYPKIYVDGFDLDEASITDARRNAQKADLADRVHFETRNAADPALAGQYDLVTAFECIHDMSDPVAGLATMRRLAGVNGSVLVMDERTNEHFSTAANPVEQFLYGFSVMGCLPASMVEKPSAAVGTVMRADTLRQYARAAGFRAIEVLPIENDFFRFYRLLTN
jgi:2-polyprenyl-3-methyl-5-hydroxy-6-metoxy-1,4-benzoquinol methylase